MVRHYTKRALGAVMLAALLPPAALAQQAQGPVLLAAGSLRQAMTEILAAWRDAGGTAVDVHYGPSGKLRQEIETGRALDVFASASTGHTDALARQGLLEPAQVFAHNDLCVVSVPRVALRADQLLEGLARPSLRLATSTPVSDPMGDYTWQFFRNADKERPGLFAILDAKALRLSGAASLAPESTLPYIAAFEQDRADAYIMYCTNAVLTKNALPALDVLRIPERLNVRSAYGIASRTGSQEGARLVRFVLGARSQDILRKYGFH
ncbi:molybdate ABC transporter substrate-binding protein [Massilia sp. CMS3.1]|uniref:molybdate ABC transporter substrate-binding protein n=1 Tax=Massilia sp. CMS3.1 TaxID=3373083 RepID=UPI003EE5409A